MCGLLHVYVDAPDRGSSRPADIGYIFISTFKGVYLVPQDRRSLRGPGRYLQNGPELDVFERREGRVHVDEVEPGVMYDKRADARPGCDERRFGGRISSVV